MKGNASAANLRLPPIDPLPDPEMTAASLIPLAEDSRAKIRFERALLLLLDQGQLSPLPLIGFDQSVIAANSKTFGLLFGLGLSVIGSTLDDVSAQHWLGPVLLETLGSQSFLLVPLPHVGGVDGVLYLDFVSKKHSWLPDETHEARRLGSRLAHRLAKSTHERQFGFFCRQLESIPTTTLDEEVPAGVGSVLASLTMLAATLVSGGAALLLTDSTGESLRFVCGCSGPTSDYGSAALPRRDEWSVPIGSGRLGRVADSGERAVIGINEIDAALLPLFGDVTTGCAVAAPVASNGKRYGVLVAWRADEEIPAGETVLEVVGRIADEIGRYYFQGLEYQRLLKRAADLERSEAQLLLYAKDLRQAFEKERRAVQRLTEVDRLKSEFLAMVSHELRTPLATISGFAAALTLAARRAEAPQMEGYAELIRQETLHLSQLVDDVLTAARLESGTLTYAFQPTLLGPLVREVVEGFRAANPTHTFNISGDRQTIPARGDPIRIRQVIVNLLGNAVKYAPDGVIDIEILTPDGRNEVWVAVQDNGIGLDEEQQARLFEKFSRIERPELTNDVGTGLGLYIASRILQAHEGRIWVESNPKQGSRFTFSLPLSEG